jgi:hypothetical protein
MTGSEFARIGGSYNTAYICTYQVIEQNIGGNYTVFRLYGYFYYGGGTQVSSQTSGGFYLDGTYIYGEYGDLENNHFAGTYEVKNTDKNNVNEAGASEYYKLSFGPTQEYVVDGERQSTVGRQMSDMEIGIITNGNAREATLINEASYATFYCKAE